MITGSFTIFVRRLQHVVALSTRVPSNLRTGTAGVAEISLQSKFESMEIGSPPSCSRMNPASIIPARHCVCLGFVFRQTICMQLVQLRKTQIYFMQFCWHLNIVFVDCLHNEFEIKDPSNECLIHNIIIRISRKSGRVHHW